jgi:hypothetical protein
VVCVWRSRAAVRSRTLPAISGSRESRYSPALVDDKSAVILLTRVDIDARLRFTRSAEASSILDIAFALSEAQAQLLEVLPRDASEGEVVRRRVERRLDLWFAWRVFEVGRNRHRAEP